MAAVITQAAPLVPTYPDAHTRTRTGRSDSRKGQVDRLSLTVRSRSLDRSILIRDENATFDRPIFVFVSMLLPSLSDTRLLHFLEVACHYL